MTGSRALKGILLGLLIGLINLVAVLFVPQIGFLTHASVIITWVVAGFFVSVTDLKMPGWAQGMLMALLIALPSLIFVFVNSILGGIWTTGLTLAFGAVLGLALGHKEPAKS